MRIPAKRLLCALFLFALSALCCGMPERPLLVPVSNPPVFRPGSPQQLKSPQEAIAAIMTACTEDLGLPAVEPLYLNLYRDAATYAASTAAFEKQRGDDVRLTLAQPHENGLHINMEAANGQSWGVLLRLLAHDYGHNIEYVLTGGARRRSEWIREGFAEWIAAKVISSLGWESYSSSLSRAERELSRYEAPLPGLSQLETSTDWLRILERPRGRIATYDLAFVAVDRLIGKTGAPGMMDYFQSGDFRESFGLARSDFEHELQATTSDLAAANRVRGGPLARKPEWKVGYRWQYALRAAGIKATVLNQVVREDLFENIPVYVLAIGKNEYPHAKDTLSVLAVLSEGKTVSKNDPPSRPLTWPLETGKQWRNNFALENVEQQLFQTIDTEVVIAGIEEVRVPAGVFRAFRIETYAFDTGELITDQWYAPLARWFVKARIYRQEGVIEQELVGLKLD